MTKTELETLKEGQLIYRVSGLGMFKKTYTCTNATDKTALLFYLTEDAAHLNYYLTEMNSRCNKISDLEGHLKDAKIAKDKLDEQYGYLKGKYPEEFI